MQSATWYLKQLIASPETLDSLLLLAILNYKELETWNQKLLTIVR
jgi:hypothetical protein